MKRFISFIVVTAMLFTTFTVISLPVSAADGIVTDYSVEGTPLPDLLNCCTVEVKEGEPFLTSLSNGGDVNFSVPFASSVDTTEYKYIALRYKAGYGVSVHGGHHFYAITSDGGPTGTGGWWTHPDETRFPQDADWHFLTFDIAAEFPSITGTFEKLRIPGVDTAGGKFYVAYLGAFKTLEDAKAFDDSFVAAHGSKLVKDSAPTDKQEKILDDLVDKFTIAKYDFTNAAYTDKMKVTTAGVDANPIRSMWTPRQGTDGSEYLISDAEKVMYLTFDAITYDERAKNGTPYRASFNLKTDDGGSNFSGIVVNYGNENNNAGDFFENSGIKADGAGSYVGRSGIGTFFKGGKTIDIYVVYYDDATGKINAINYEFDSGVDYSAAYQNYTIVDDGIGKVSFFNNEKLLAYVTYADDGLLPLEVSKYCERYYRTAKIFAADGTEMASTDKALISYTKSVALGSRSHGTRYTSLEFVDSAAPAKVIAPATAVKNSVLEITVNGCKTSRDWVGIAPSAGNDYQPYAKNEKTWSYSNASSYATLQEAQTPGSNTVADGKVKLFLDGLVPGEYTIYLFENDGYTVLAQTNIVINDVETPILGNNSPAMLAVVMIIALGAVVILKKRLFV